MLYNKFSDYLKKRYGEKVYKLPVNIPCTCPNRDGLLGLSGCIFCGDEGAGFETLPDSMNVSEQLRTNKNYIGKKYGSEKFIAYFQNYTNTYMPFETFKSYMKCACDENVAALYISTRPDCIYEEQLEFLNEISKNRGIDVVIEIGLQSVNLKTLKFLERGHSLADFIDAAVRVKRHGLFSCAHVITDIPDDSIDDVVEGARILSALGVDQVKCHSLYILEGTHLGELFKRGEFEPMPLEFFIERTISFLEHLDPGIVVQRLIGRAPRERTLFCNWGTSWWKILDMIEQKMDNEGRFQGKYAGFKTSGP